MTPNTFKWCFIGAGKLAGQVARDIAAAGGHTLVSVYTHSPEKGRAFAKKHGCVAYDDAAAAMTADGVQGVYVVTPHNSHYEYVKLAIELGKPVLCEKPFMTDAAQAAELLALAREKGVYVAEAMWTWFSPIANQVKKWLDGGDLGDIQRLGIDHLVDVRGYAPRLTDPKLAGGALLDTGVYPITYLYRLFGNPDKIVCNGVIEGGVDMEEDVDLTFKNGATYRASISIRDGRSIERLRIAGTKGEVDLCGFHSANQVTLRRKDGSTETLSADGNIVNEFNRAAEEILAGCVQSAYVPHQATLDVMKIMDECRRQMNLVYPFERG